MKSLVSSAMFLLGMVLSIQGQQKVEQSEKLAADSLAKIAVAHPDWDLTDIAKRSPACDCQDKCQCAEPCLCNVIDEKPAPLTVGKPPEHTLDDAKPLPMQVAAVTEVAETFTHPQPQVLPVAPPPKPQVLPVKPKAAPVAATGHYEMRQQCGRGGCSMVRVWVPHSNGQPAAAPAVYQQSSCGSCGPGGCGRRGIFGGRGLFGRRR